MSFVDKIQEFEAAIEAAMSHAGVLSTMIKDLKMIVGVADKVAHVVAPGNPATLGLDMAATVLDQVSNAADAINEAQQP